MDGTAQRLRHRYKHGIFLSMVSSAEGFPGNFKKFTEGSIGNELVPETPRERRAALAEAVEQVSKSHVPNSAPSTPLPAESPSTSRAIEEIRVRAKERASRPAFDVEDERLRAEENRRREQYFAALRDQRHNRGFFTLLQNRFNVPKRDKTDDPADQLRTLRRNWKAIRFDRASLLLRSVEAHGQKRTEAERRLYIGREVVLSAEKTEYEERTRNLSSRDQQTVEVMSKGFKKIYEALPFSERLVLQPSMLTAGAVASQSNV
jgi:hypothetical protein